VYSAVENYRLSEECTIYLYKFTLISGNSEFIKYGTDRTGFNTVSTIYADGSVDIILFCIVFAMDAVYWTYF